MAKEKKNVYTGTGHRKTSVARVTLTPGTGKITVNGRDVNEYMPFATLVMDIKQPLVLTNNENTFDITVKVNGGGFSGQAGAIRLAIAKALKPILKIEDGLVKQKTQVRGSKKIIPTLIEKLKEDVGNDFSDKDVYVGYGDDLELLEKGFEKVGYPKGTLEERFTSLATAFSSAASGDELQLLYSHNHFVLSESDDEDVINRVRREVRELTSKF